MGPVPIEQDGQELSFDFQVGESWQGSHDLEFFYSDATGQGSQPITDGKGSLVVESAPPSDAGSEPGGVAGG